MSKFFYRALMGILSITILVEIKIVMNKISEILMTINICCYEFMSVGSKTLVLCYLINFIF
jgi:hypothetical protein